MTDGNLTVVVDRAVELDHATPGTVVRLFRQAGGCLEIVQIEDDQQDIVHICADDVDGFVHELVSILPDFVKATPPLY